MDKNEIEHYRVQAAIAAMQGMLGNDSYTDIDIDIAQWAVAHADALMKELGLAKE